MFGIYKKYLFLVIKTKSSRTDVELCRILSARLGFNDSKGRCGGGVITTPLGRGVPWAHVEAFQEVLELVHFRATPQLDE